MNSKDKIERIIHLNLEVDDRFICVTSIDNESGEQYTLDFTRGVDGDGVPYHKPESIMMRIGMEVWSWIAMMLDKYDNEEE